MVIDVTFDFRTDARGKVPDSHSPRFAVTTVCCRASHCQMELPSTYQKRILVRICTTPRVWGWEFFLSSDSVIPSFTKWKSLKPMTDQIPESENEAFRKISYSIGGMMVFPGNQIDRKPTISRARGFNGAIFNRFDFTLECVRRFYANVDGPLASTLWRYANFLLFSATSMDSSTSFYSMTW